MQDPTYIERTDADAMPMVGSDRSGNAPLWIGLLVIGLLAAALFVAMEGRRQRQLVAPVQQSNMSDAVVQPYRPPSQHQG